MNISYRPSINFVFTTLALLGALGGVYLYFSFRETLPIAHPLAPITTPPFKNFIIGAGMLETQGENIEVGAMVDGVVESVFVKTGYKVAKGEAIFTLDKRQVQSDLDVKKALLAGALTNVEKAKISFNAAKNQFDLVKNIKDHRAVSKEEFIKRHDDFLLAQKESENAKASLKVAEAQFKQAVTLMDLYTVRAPINGEILQVNIRKGENIARKRKPLMLIGNINKYYVRVDIDEYDAWRFQKSQPAVAFLRGNSRYHVDLEFEYVEPYVIPKKLLTGDYAERMDTRVLQAIYSFDPKKMPSYLGQQVDVYIRADDMPMDIHYGPPIQEIK